MDLKKKNRNWSTATRLDNPQYILNVLGGAKDCLAKGSTLVGSGVQVIEDHLLQVALNFLHLTQDHWALAGDLGLTQFWVLDDISQNLDSLGHILRQTLGVEDGLLPGGVGVQVSTQVLDLQLQIGLGALGSALE